VGKLWEPHYCSASSVKHVCIRRNQWTWNTPSRLSFCNGIPGFHYSGFQLDPPYCVNPMNTGQNGTWPKRHHISHQNGTNRSKSNVRFVYIVEWSTNIISNFWEYSRTPSRGNVFEEMIQIRDLWIKKSSIMERNAIGGISSIHTTSRTAGMRHYWFLAPSGSEKPTTNHLRPKRSLVIIWRQCTLPFHITRPKDCGSTNQRPQTGQRPQKKSVKNGSFLEFGFSCNKTASTSSR